MSQNMNLIRVYFVIIILVEIFSIFGYASAKSSFDFTSTTTIEYPERNGTIGFDPLETKAKIHLHLLRKDADLEIFGVQVVKSFPESENNYYLYVTKNQKINRIFARHGDPKTWSIGLAFISLLQRKLNIEDAKICKNSYQEIDETVSIRELSFCEQDPENSLVKFFDYHTLFQQYVSYVKDSNDLKHITFEENFNFNGYLYARVKLGHKGEIKLSKAEDVQEGFPDCTIVDIEACISMATNKNGYVLIAESVEKLIYNLLHSSKSPAIEEYFADEKSKAKCILGTQPEIDALNLYTETTSGFSFITLSKRLEKASEEDLIKCLTMPENYANLHALVSLLAINGRVKGLNVMERLKQKLDDYFAYSELRNVYLTMLSYAPDPNLKLMEAMLAKFKTNEVDQIFSLSFGSLIRRYCRKFECDDSSKNRNAQRLFSAFEDKFKSCESSDDTCFTNVVSGMINTRSPYFVPLLKSYVCSKSGKFVSHIFAYFKTLDAKHWSSHEIRQLIFDTLANRCPLPQSQSVRIAAVELSLISVDQVNDDIVENLRKLFDSLNDSKSVDREIISYLTSAVRYLASINQNFGSAYKEMKSEKYFNDFLLILSKAQSSTARLSLNEIGGLSGFGQLDIEFNRGMLQRSSAEVGFRFENETTILLGLELFSSGIAKVASTFGLTGSSDNEGDTDQSTGFWSGEDVKAGMKLTFLNNLQTTVVFFNGEAQLMSAVMSASGDTMVGFNNTVALNRLTIHWPLVNGLTIDLAMASALSFKLTGSIEISIWYRTSHSVVTESAIFVTSGSFLLKSTQGKTTLRSKIELSAQFGAEFLTDLDFYADPFRMCFQIDQIPYTANYKSENIASVLDIIGKSTLKKKPVKKWVNFRQYKGEGSCVATQPKIHKACAELFGE